MVIIASHGLCIQFIEEGGRGGWATKILERVSSHVEKQDDDIQLLAMMSAFLESAYDSPKKFGASAVMRAVTKFLRVGNLEFQSAHQHEVACTAYLKLTCVSTARLYWLLL